MSLTRCAIKVAEIIFCRTFKMSHGPAGTLALAPGWPFVSESNTRRSTDSAIRAAIANSDFFAEVSYAWEFFLSGGRLRLGTPKPRSRLFGTVVSRRSAIRRSRFFHRIASPRISSPPLSRFILRFASTAEFRMQSVLLWPTFQISHGPAGPLAVATG
jgi:hypothetical protein